MEAALPGLGLDEMYDALKEPRMWHLPLFEAPNALAESLIVGRELLFVEHFMRQQACQPEALNDCLPSMPDASPLRVLFALGSSTLARTP